jgi:hypothetical protein
MIPSVMLAAVMITPHACVADSIDYASGGQKPDVIIMGSVAAGHTWSVTDDLTQISDLTTGKITSGAELGTVDITSGKLFSCGSALCFSGGSVVIKNESGKMIFTGMIASGTISQSGGNVFLNAGLRNGGVTEIKTKSGIFSSDTAISSAHVVPEPSSYMLLGSGLIGLTWMLKKGVRYGSRT